MIDFEGGNEPVEHDYTHPERHFKRLVPIARPGEPRIPTPDDFAKGWKVFKDFDEEHRELCWACGWGTPEQTNSFYSPRIRVMHARDNIGLWAIGSKWLIRDQPNDETLGNEYMTFRFLRDQPDLKIPLVKEMRIISEPGDSIRFTMISRAQGKMLSSIWDTLSIEQQNGYKDQMVEILKEMRKFTAPRPQKVNGDRLDDCLFICDRRHPPGCTKIGFTDEEWLEELSEILRGGLSRIHRTTDPEVIEEKYQELKELFPKGGPYVLTHTDLNLYNIIVKDDKIQAIIDWEMAGYYPWWAEPLSDHLWGDHLSAALLHDIWGRVHSDLEDSKMQAFYKKLKPFLLAINKCERKHIPPRGGFLRPPFCECQPYCGLIRSVALGAKEEHKVNFYKPWPKAG